jgi:hypothetical protein
MKARFEPSRRFSAAGVTTAAVLIVILAMGVSTLVPSAAPVPGDPAASSSTQVVQAHHQKPLKKS